MRIAIVGGIGSGKSTALKVAKRLGFATLSADEVNARMLEDEDYTARLIEAFPAAQTDGKLDKAKLAKLVFSHKRQLEKLNSIAHPIILQKIAQFPYDTAVVEMPVITECAAQDMFDEILLVRTPTLRRIKFLRGRGMRLFDALRRIKSQPPTRLLEGVATVVVDNDGDIAALEKKVEDILKDMRAGDVK